MPDEPGSSAPSSSGRKLLIAVDDSAECESALGRALRELYRPGDCLHLVHVLPKAQVAAMFGAPPVDFLPRQDPVAYEQLLQNAEHFITDRFLPKLGSMQPDPVVHIVKGEVDTDSIGNVICRKAREVDAAAVVMASHTRSKLTEFFLGSVTNYCTRAPALPGPWHPWIGPPVQPRDRVRSCLRACASACGVCMYPGRTRV